MYLLLPTGDECVMYAGRHGHVPCTEQRDFHVPSPPLSKQWLLLRNTTPREREPGEKNTWPVYLMCTCTQADPETPSRRAPEKEQVGIRLARFRHVRYGPPSRCRLSSHVPLRREAARSSCVARISCSSRRATDKWLLAFRRHCGMRHLLHGCLWRKQTTRFHAEYWVTTWVRQGLFVCEQTRCYALIPAWCPIFSAQ